MAHQSKVAKDPVLQIQDVERRLWKDFVTHVFPILDKAGPKYDQSTEPEQLPEHLSWTFRLAELQKIIHAVAQLQVEIFDHAGGISGQLVQLRKKISTRVSSIAPPDPFHILFTGFPGEGKSAVVNSLVRDEGDVCESGPDTVAITSHPRILRFCEKKDEFKAWVVFLEKSYMKQMVQDLIDAMVQCLDRLDDHGGDRDQSLIDYKYQQSKAIKFANALLIASRRKHYEKDDDDDDEETIKRLVVRQPSGIEEHPFMEFCLRRFVMMENKLKDDKSLIKGNKSDSGALYIELREADLDTLKQALHKYTHGDLGIFTKEIEFFVHAEVLRHNVRFVDLPGLKDTNPLRNKLTHDWIKHGDAHVICVNAKRSQSRDEICEKIRNAIGRVGRENVFLALTHIDLLNDGQLFATRDGPDFSHDATVSNLKDVSAALKAWKESPEQEKKMRKRYYKWQKKNCERSSIKEKCVGAYHFFNQEFYDETEQRSINVHFLCPTSYREAANDIDGRSCKLLLDAVASGIPGLRISLMGLSAQRTAEAVHSHIRSKEFRYFKLIDNVSNAATSADDAASILQIKQLCLDDWVQRVPFYTSNERSGFIANERSLIQKIARNCCISDKLLELAHEWLSEKGGKAVNYQNVALLLAKKSIGFRHQTRKNKDGEKETRSWEWDKDITIKLRDRFDPLFARTLAKGDEWLQQISSALDHVDRYMRDEITAGGVHLENSATLLKDWRTCHIDMKQRIKGTAKTLKRYLEKERTLLEAYSASGDIHPGAAGRALVHTFCNFRDDFFKPDSNKYKDEMKPNVLPKLQKYVLNGISGDSFFQYYSEEYLKGVNGVLEKVFGGLHTFLVEKCEEFNDDITQNIRPQTDEESPQNLTLRKKLKEILPANREGLDDLCRKANMVQEAQQLDSSSTMTQYFLPASSYLTTHSITSALEEVFGSWLSNDPMPTAMPHSVSATVTKAKEIIECIKSTMRVCIEDRQSPAYPSTETIINACETQNSATLSDTIRQPLVEVIASNWVKVDTGLPFNPEWLILFLAYDKKRIQNDAQHHLITYPRPSITGILTPTKDEAEFDQKHLRQEEAVDENRLTKKQKREKRRGKATDTRTKT